MSEKFIRCFAYGLAEGETLTATVEGVEVEFTPEAAQIDVPIAQPADPADPNLEP